MTTPDKVQIGQSQDYLDGVAVDTSAGTGLFRETVVLADPTDGGGLANIRQLSTQLVDTDKGVVTNTVIHGLTTGGGGYRDVKVNPSGALTVDATGSSVSVSNFPATQPISATSLPLPTGAATDATVAATNPYRGTTSYFGGASGTVSVPSGARVVSLSAHSVTGGSITIFGGSSIPVPANNGFATGFDGFVGPGNIVFTGTDSYYVAVNQ